MVAKIARFARLDCKLQSVPCKLNFKFKEKESMMCCYASCKTKEPNEDNYEWFCDYGQQKLVIVPEKGDVFQANCIYMSFYAQSLL